RRAGERRDGERDEVDEEVAGEGHEGRRADHRDAAGDEYARRERRMDDVRALVAGPPLERAGGEELLRRARAGDDGCRDAADDPGARERRDPDQRGSEIRDDGVYDEPA